MITVAHLTDALADSLSGSASADLFHERNVK